MIKEKEKKKSERKILETSLNMVDYNIDGPVNADSEKNVLRKLSIDVKKDNCDILMSPSEQRVNMQILNFKKS